MAFSQRAKFGPQFATQRSNYLCEENKDCWCFYSYEKKEKSNVLCGVWMLH